MQEGGIVCHAIKTTGARESASICYALKWERAARCQYMRACLPCHKGNRFAMVNRRQLATMRAGLFRMQSRRRRWRDLQPVNAARRVATTPQRIHAAKYMQCQTCYANSPRIALYRLCRIALYPPRATHCKSCQRPFQTV